VNKSCVKSCNFFQQTAESFRKQIMDAHGIKILEKKTILSIFFQNGQFQALNVALIRITVIQKNWVGLKI